MFMGASHQRGNSRGSRQSMPGESLRQSVDVNECQDVVCRSHPVCRPSMRASFQREQKGRSVCLAPVAGYLMGRTRMRACVATYSVSAERRCRTDPHQRGLTLEE